MAKAQYVDPVGGADNLSTRDILPRTSITIASTGTTFDYTISTGGARITRYILEVPDYTTGTPTTTLSVIDLNSVTVYTGAAHAENANYSIPVDLELVGFYTFRLTLSGASGGATTVNLTLLGY